ncbi:GNAT family N-acetyltransferase [Solibacillus sp. CAU 1738]|uniref:GNAT family N-acetyltransferase n=1 Tax=Solibacillus sp. CAU 1738 TaxID=3140363 RepID=UPI003260D982
MNSITFEHIHKLGHIITENEEFQQYHFPEMLSRYSSNFIEFKKMPTLAQFQEREHTLRDFHKQHGQQHIKFSFPVNEMISDDIKVYLTAANYDIGFLELYAISPSEFPTTKNSTIDVQLVTNDNIDAFLQLQYDADLKYGETFAKEKQAILHHQFLDGSKHQIIAYYAGIPVGSVEIIEQSETAEIDNLFVVEAFQRKGVGSQIQQFVMEKFQNKTVILVADGEDTAREMYQKQNYVYLGFQYEVLKVEE